MKLRLPLALLVAWALACGGGEEDDVTETPPPPTPPTDGTPTTTPPPTTPPTTPPTDGTATTTPPTDGTTTPPTDGTAATDGTTEEGPVEVKTEGETRVETRTIKTSASVPVGQRPTLRTVAERQLQKRATELGYTKISNFQMGDARCNDKNCTVSATATASRTVKVEEEEKSGQ